MNLNENEIINIQQLLNSSDINNHKLAIELAIGYGGMTYNYLAECMIDKNWLKSKYINSTNTTLFELYEYSFNYWGARPKEILTISIYKNGKFTSGTIGFKTELLNMNLIQIVQHLIEDVYKT